MKLFKRVSHLFHPQRSNNHRAKALHPEAYFFYVIIGLAIFVGVHSLRYWPSFLKGVLGYASSISASQVVEKTNQQRLQQGLPPLVVNEKLNQAALAKAQHIFTHQYWAHISPDGAEPWDFIKEAEYQYQAAGENLARDFSNSDDMMAAWMASPTHKENIVSPKYEEIGVAVVDGELLGYETTLVVQMFGRQMAVIPQIGDATANSSKKFVLAYQPQESLKDERYALQADVSNDVALLADNHLTDKTTVTIVLPELKRPPLFTPLQITKAFFLAIMILVITTLLYDTVVIHNKNTVRLVGKNIAHILLFLTISFIILFFKGGLVG